MRIDKEKGDVVLARLHRAYIAKEPPFDLPEAKPPQIKENLPDNLVWGSREHGLFLWTSCYYMRGGIESDEAFVRLTKLYDVIPEVFFPEEADAIAPEGLARELRSIGLGFNSEQIASIWVENLVKLRDRWFADPRIILDGVKTYEEACARIKNTGKNGFKGFREKMVSMIIYFYMHAGIIGKWKFPVPVDFHVLRTLFSHQIIVPENGDGNGSGFYTTTTLAMARSVVHNFCVEYKVDPIDLCDSIWINSRLACSRHPGNQSLVLQKDARRSKIIPVWKWSEAQTRTVESTCVVCSVAPTCSWCVPAAEYYVNGKIVLRERRELPPQGRLFLKT